MQIQLCLPLTKGAGGRGRFTDTLVRPKLNIQESREVIILKKRLSKDTFLKTFKSVRSCHCRPRHSSTMPGCIMGDV